VVHVVNCVLSECYENQTFARQRLILLTHKSEKAVDFEEKEGALLFNITQKTDMYRQNNRFERKTKYYPAIMDFLGYYPCIRPKTLATN